MAEQKADEGAVSFRLEYLNFGGRGEPIKLAASYSGIAFESKMMTMAEQKAWKAEGKQCWSGPPDIVLLDKDGKEVTAIGQSNAILRLVGLWENSNIHPIVFSLSA